MADTKEYLLGEIKRRHERAQELVALAEKEVRDNTEEEMAEIKSLTGRIEEHKIELKRMEDRDALKKQLADLGSVTEVATQEAVEVKAKSLGEAFVRSSDYQAIIAQGTKEGIPEFKMPTIELKAAGDAILEATGNNADAIAPTWLPDLYAPGLVQFPIRITNVINTVQLATGNTAFWATVTTRSIADMTSTDESENKAGADFAFDQDSAQVLKWTAFGGASEEMFQDAPTIANYINTQIGFMAEQKEEKYIADTLYAAANAPVDGSGVSGTPIAYDAVLEAMTDIRVAGGNPTAVILNPFDWARMAAERAVAGTGNYFSGGPYQAPNQGLWGGVTEIQTPVVPEGTGLVGDFTRGATLFRKGGVRVNASNGYNDYFRRNLIAIRGEVRSVVGVYNPEFFARVFFGS